MYNRTNILKVLRTDGPGF